VIICDRVSIKVNVLLFSEPNFKNLFGVVIPVSKAFTLLSASIRASKLFPGDGKSISGEK
jgi:hypothetical protein